MMAVATRGCGCVYIWSLYICGQNICNHIYQDVIIYVKLACIGGGGGGGGGVNKGLCVCVCVCVCAGWVHMWRLHMWAPK